MYGYMIQIAFKHAMHVMQCMSCSACFRCELSSCGFQQLDKAGAPRPTLSSALSAPKSSLPKSKAAYGSMRISFRRISLSVQGGNLCVIGFLAPQLVTFVDVWYLKRSPTRTVEIHITVVFQTCLVLVVMQSAQAQGFSSDGRCSYSQSCCRPGAGDCASSRRQLCAVHWGRCQGCAWSDV